MMIGTPVALQDNFLRCVRKKTTLQELPRPSRSFKNGVSAALNSQMQINKDYFWNANFKSLTEVKNLWYFLLYGGENVPIWEVVRSGDVANRRQTAACTVDGCFIWPRRTLQKRTNCLFGAFTDMSKHSNSGSHVNVCTFLWQTNTLTDITGIVRQTDTHTNTDTVANINLL